MSDIVDEMGGYLGDGSEFEEADFPQSLPQDAAQLRTLAYAMETMSHTQRMEAIQEWANKRAEAREAYLLDIVEHHIKGNPPETVISLMKAALTTKTNTLEESAKGTPFEGFFEGDNLVDKTNKGEA